MVRERYPRFIDALSDLDDALTLTYLFAALPSEKNIKPKVINSAKSLAAAWGAYCATAGCITKSFISVKGVYLEATIKGNPIRWIVPHSFTQFMPDDVDYRVMSTFFEFYETLLHFVMFKLYNDIGVRYPLPLVDSVGEVKGSTSYILGGHLRSLTNAMKSTSGEISKVVSETVDEEADNDQSAKKSKAQKKKDKQLIKTVGAALNSIEEDSDDGDEEDEDDVDISGPLKAALDTMANDEVRSGLAADDDDIDEALKRRRLFEGLTFFLSREVPRGYLELICLAFGGKVGWEGPNSPISVSDPSITHHIVDRPKLPASYDALPKSREFIQPQWILDCSNFMFLLPIAKYTVGASLPPHLSPWVDNEEEGYKPAYAEEIERLKNGESIEDIDEMPKTPAITDEKAEGSEDEDMDEDAGEEEESSAEEEEEEDSESKKKKAEKKRKREQEEAHALAKSMMSKKAAHLYGRMQHGIAKKQASVDELKNRRREIESSREKDKDGNTIQMQKVKRLREERKKLEDDYSNTGGTMKKSKKKKSKKSL